MAIVRTAGFRVRPESREHAEAVVATFVASVLAGEPGMRLLVALQDQAEPTRFTLLTILEDAEAEAAHNAAEWSIAFGRSLNGHLAGGFSYLDYAEVPGTEPELPAPTPEPEFELPTPEPELPEPELPAPELPLIDG